MIMQHQLDAAYKKYWAIRRTMPKHMRHEKIDFDEYIGFRYIHESEWIAPPHPHDWVFCSDEAEKRIQQLLSDHGTALLWLWAVRQQSKRRKKSPK